MMVKEEFFEKGFTAINEKVKLMLDYREKFKQNMVIAKETAINDPGSGQDVFLYHINYILKYGNARYLKNELINNQSLVEIWNLDVLTLALLVIIIILAIVLSLLIKMIKYAYRKVAKQKTD